MRRQIERSFLWDNMLSSGAFWAAAGTVVASLTSYYELPLSLSNVIVGLTATLSILQVAGSAAYNRTASPRRFLYVVNVLWRVLLPVTYLAVLLPREIGRIVSFVAYCSAMALFHIVAPMQTDWMVHGIKGTADRNYYSLREMTFMLTYTITFCAVNLTLSHGDKVGTQWFSFIVIGILLACMLSGSLLFLFRLPHTFPTQTPRSIRGMLGTVLRNNRFRPILLLNITWGFFTMLIGNYSALYQVQVVHIDFITLMIWLTVANLARTVLTSFAGSAAGRLGWKPVIAGCMAVYAVCGALWACMDGDNSAWAYPLATILGAIPLSGINVGVLQFQVAAASEEDRSGYFAVNSTLCGVCALLGAGVCSALIAFIQRSGWDLRLPFWVGAAGVLLCAAMALRLPVEDPAPAHSEAH